MEYKVFSSEVKLVGDRTVEGLAAITGNIDSGNDRILRGAFRKTIKERSKRVKHLWQHDMWSPPIAAIDALKEVGREDLPEDLQKTNPEATGGLLVVRTYLNTPRADEVLEGIKSGAITEMSFGYDPIKWDNEEVEIGDDHKIMVRNLRELRLWDTSDVIWGMNSLTVAGIKSYEELQQLFGAALLPLAEKLAENENTLHALQEAVAKVLETFDTVAAEEVADLLAEQTEAEPQEVAEAAKALTTNVLRRLALVERSPILRVL